MAPTESNPNSPVWTPHRPKGHEQFQEVWYVKLNDRDGTRALWLRFTLLVTQQGFQKIAETWAVFFQKDPGGKSRELLKTAVKQRFGIQSFSYDETTSCVRIENCLLSPDRTQGQVQAKGKSIQWDLLIRSLQTKAVSLLPQVARSMGLLGTEIWTVNEELFFSGTVKVDGIQYEFSDAPGMKGHWSGVKSAHSWVWGQANTFQNDKGEHVSFIFEGITARPRLGRNLSGPKLSSYYFFYQGEHYFFNSLWDAFQLKSKSTITDWSFQADQGELSFRGTARADHKDFAGVTFEDTDGSVLYCANSKLSTISIHVYRRGKIEATFNASGTAAFEVVSREKNPYIQELL